MNFRIAVFSILMGIAIGSLCIGQGKPTAKSQAASDARMSDHEKIEKLLSEVAELQKKLASLEKKYETHTHPLRGLETAQFPGSIECDQTVVQWSSTGTNSESVSKVCRQIASGNISVLTPWRQPIVTGSPLP